MPLVSDLDPTTAPTPDTEELDAWGALQALRTPPPASVDPDTADAFRQRSRQVLSDYKAKQERAGAPLFPEHTARANSARRDQLRGLFLGDLAETLDPERYAALQHRAGQTGDPEAYIARQSLKTYLKATTGQDLAPHHYPLARRQLAQALGVEDGDKPVRDAIAERFRRHDADTKLLQASATQIAETVIGGDLELADQLTADLLPQFSADFREAARDELAAARAESLRTVRAATPHARRLTEILGTYMGRGAEAFQRTKGLRVSLDYDTAADAVEYLNTLPPEVRDVAISLAGRELETLTSQEGTIATAGETTATRTKLLGTQAADYLTALWANYRQGVLQGIPGEAAEAARTLERRRFEEFDQRFQTRAALIGTAGSVPTYEPSDSWAQKLFLAGSAQVPTFASFFSPASLGALGLSMAGQSLEAQRLQNPDGSFQGQLGSASISAALQLGAERAFTGQGLKFLRGKSPTIASMLSRAGIRGKYLRGITGGTMNAAAAGVTEYSEEILQDGIDRLFSDVQRELDGVSTTATTAPGTWFREWLEPWAPGSGSRQAEETFYAILPFALIFAGLAGSYQHFRYGDFLQQSGTMLRAVGVPGPVIEEIQKADPETAARLTKEAFDAGLEETTAAQRAKALETFRESARLWADSGMPVVYPDEADDGTPVYVFQADPAGQRATRRIFDTEEEALLAWQQAKNQIDEAALLASVQAAQGAALEQTFGEGAALEGKGQAIPLDQRAPALRAASKIKDAFGQPLITAAQIAARVQQFLVQGGQRKDVDNLVVKARRHAVRLADGITRQILQYFTDTDAVAILEDAAEAFADQAIADSMLDPAELADQIRAAEAATGSTYLQADYDPATYLEDPTPLLEAFSAIARDYTFARIRSEQMPAELRDWISTTAIASGQTFAYAEELRRSPRLAKAIAEGRIDARFESLLADAIGIDQAARDARLEAAYRAQLAAEAMEGIPEIATAAKAKLPHPQTLRDRSHPLTGEVQRIYDALKRPTRQTTKAGRPVMRTNEANAFFLPYGEMVDLDQVRASLNELGFSFDTPADLLTALDESLNYGVRTHATRGMAEDSAPTFSLGRAAITPTAQTRTYPTEQGGVIGPATFAISAYHGTPHKVDRFTTDKIGTGEGVQAYGWGLYFAADERVAKSYRDALSGKPMVPQRRERLETKLRVLNKRLERARAAGAATSAIKASISELEEELATTGNLYRVTIKVEDDQLLDWDKPLSEQSKAVRKAWDTLEESPPEGVSGFDWRMAMLDAWFDGPGLHNVGATAYLALINQFGRKAGERVGGEHARNASATLLAAGIRGIRYLDGNSRRNSTLYVVTDPEGKRLFTTYEEQEAIDYVNDGGPEADLNYTTETRGSYNYVIFDEADIEILEENGQPVDTTPTFALSPSHDHIASTLSSDYDLEAETDPLEGGKVRTIAKLFHQMLPASRRIDWEANWRGQKKSFEKRQEARFLRDVGRASERILEALEIARRIFPNFQSWYEGRLRMAMAIFEELDPDVAKPEHNFAIRLLLAVTSNGNGVREQTEDTWSVYKSWKEDGLFSTGGTIRGKRVAEIRKALERVDQMVAKHGWEKVEQFLSTNAPTKQIRKRLVEDMGFTKNEAKKITGGELIDEMVPGSLIFGAKLGSFFNNLSGNFDTTTMDRWFMRTFGRALGMQLSRVPRDRVNAAKERFATALRAAVSDPDSTLILQGAGLRAKPAANVGNTVKLAKYFEKEAHRKNLSPAADELRKATNAYYKIADGFTLNEAPKSGGHRRFIRLAMEQAREIFSQRTGQDWNAAELQALLWYFEKAVHDTYGSKQTDDAPDYASAANGLFRRERGADAGAFEPSDAVRGRKLPRGSLAELGEAAASFALSGSSLNRIEGAIAAKMAEGPTERADYYTRLRDRLAGVLIRYKEFALAAGATDAEQALRKAREAIAETSSIIQALPAEARGRVTLPVSDILDAKTQRGRVTAMLRLIDQADAALETTLQDQYREALAKLLDLAKPDVNPATRQARSRLTPETQREVMAIYDVMALLPEEAGIRQFNAENDLQRAEDRLNATDPADTEAMKKAQAEYIAAALTKNRLDTFGAVLGGSAAELARAHDALLQLYKTGRYARNILDDQRRQELAAMREEVLATLKPVDQPTHSRRTSKAGFGEGFASWIFGHKSFHDVMEALFPNSTTARHLQDLARRADTGVKRAHIAARERWEQWARTALDLPRRNWRLKLQTILADLSKRRDFNIEIREGVKFREESLDEEQAIAILEGRMKPGWQDDPMAMQSLRQALADFRILRDRDKKRVRKVRFQRLTSRGAPAFLHLSDLEATYILQLAAQKDYAATLDAYGFTEEVLHQLMLATDERALRIGDFLQREYAAEYDRLNPVFRELYGMDMPKIRNYAPARFHHQNATPDLDPEAGEGVMVNALSSGFTRNRVHHLARPRQKNALDLYWEHIQQVEYFIHWASVVRELRAVFLNPRVRFALEGNFGEKAAKDFYTWIDVLAADGNLSAAAARTNQELTRRMQLGLAATGLAFNVGSVFKQFQAALNGLLEMTTRESLLGFKEALRNPELFATAWRSETIQQRIEEGFGPEDRRVLDAANAKPSVIFELYRIGRLPLAWNDAAATTLYAAAAYGVHYRKAIDEGKMTPEAAREHALAVMDRVVKRTAQPATTQDRSLAELTVGRFGMLLGYIFRSDPRQKFAIAARTVEDLRAGRISKRTAARRLLFSWFIYGFMNEALSDLWASVSRDDDPDRWDWRDYLSSSLAGPLSGAGVLGNMAEALIRGTIGTGFFGGTTYTAQAGDLMAYHHGSRLVSTLLDEADADLGDLIKAALSDARDYSAIFSGLDPRAAAPAVGFRILRDTYGVLDNWTETEAERQDNILAEYKQTQKLEREAAAIQRDRTAPVLTPQERALSSLKVEHRAQAIQRIAAPMTEAARRDYLARLHDLGILTKATREAME